MSFDRFRYVDYDRESEAQDSALKREAYKLLGVIESFEPSRERSLALTKLEEVVMWAGKAIRSQQLTRS